MIYCSACCREATQVLRGLARRCLFCGSDTNLGVWTRQVPEWDCPYELEGEVLKVPPNFQYAVQIGKQYGTVIAGRLLDHTPALRLTLYELTKLVKHKGYLHLELARPTERAQDYPQVFAPLILQTIFRGCGLDIIKEAFPPGRQSYWLQKMNEVFPL